MIYPELILGQSRKLDDGFEDITLGDGDGEASSLDASQGNPQVRAARTWNRKWELGCGSFGIVYLEESGKKEFRAVKDIMKKRSSCVDIDYGEELRAVELLAKNKRLFVQLLGWFDSGDEFHIAMEYMSHGNLRKHMDEKWSESEAKAVIRQLLDGLDVVHQEGFVHRALKPENIFVASTSPMRVKIGDFGLAKLAGSDPVFGAGAGSMRPYDAPEMAPPIKGDPSRSRFAVDLWAIGIIAYELLTGAVPFTTVLERTSYFDLPESQKEALLSKYISWEGIEFIGNALTLLPEDRMTAQQGLDSEWLWPFSPPPSPTQEELAGSEHDPSEREANQAQELAQEVESVSSSTSIPKPPAAGKLPRKAVRFEEVVTVHEI